MHFLGRCRKKLLIVLYPTVVSFGTISNFSYSITLRIEILEHTIFVIGLRRLKPNEVYEAVSQQHPSCEARVHL